MFLPPFHILPPKGLLRYQDSKIVVHTVRFAAHYNKNYTTNQYDVKKLC